MAPSGTKVRLKGGTHRRHAGPGEPGPEGDQSKGEIIPIEVEGEGEKDQVEAGDVFYATEHELEAFPEKFEVLGDGQAAPAPTSDYVYHGLPMTSKTALRRALDKDVDHKELGQYEPEGKNGYTTSQVDAVAKEQADSGDESGGSEEGGSQEGESEGEGDEE